MKDVPTCHFDLQIMSPPNCLTIILQICSPRPIPFVFSFCVSSKNPNSLNNFCWSFYFIPTPESSTIISTTPYFAFSKISTKICSSGNDKSDFWLKTCPFTFTDPPLLVNLSELDIKFKRIWDNLYWSEHILTFWFLASLLLPLTSKLKFIPNYSALYC